MCVCVFGVGKEKERGCMKLRVQSAELGEAFVSSALATILHHAGPHQRHQPTNGHLSSTCMTFLYAKV